MQRILKPLGRNKNIEPGKLIKRVLRRYHKNHQKTGIKTHMSVITSNKNVLSPPIERDTDTQTELGNKIHNFAAFKKHTSASMTDTSG